MHPLPSPSILCTIAILFFLIPSQPIYAIPISSPPNPYVFFSYPLPVTTFPPTHSITVWVHPIAAYFIFPFMQVQFLPYEGARKTQTLRASCHAITFVNRLRFWLASLESLEVYVSSIPFRLLLDLTEGFVLIHNCCPFFKKTQCKLISKTTAHD